MAGWMLYHYGVSPYAEKARLMLGYKQLAWASIEVPVIPPRPGLQQVLGAFRHPGKPDWPAVDDERLGREVSLQPDDYGRDPVTGMLTAVSDRHVTVTREAPDVGWVHLHFLKVGYEVVPAEAA